MKIKRPKTLGIFSLLLILASAGAFIAPRSHAFGAVPDKSNQSRASRSTPRTETMATEVTSSDRTIACKRNCEEHYYSCVAAKKAKGWSDDRAEKTCGLTGRTCKAHCDR